LSEPGRSRRSRLKRRIDRRLYRIFFALGRAIARPPVTRPDPMALRRVLIVRHDRLGDWVVTSPLVALLSEVAPNAEIDVLASPANAVLPRTDERVSEVIVNDHRWLGWLRALRRLRRRRYDLIISPIYYRHLREGLVATLAARRHTYTLSVYRPRRYQGMFSAVVRIAGARTHMTERLLYTVQQGLVGDVRRAGESAARWPMRLFVDAKAESHASSFLSRAGIGEFVAINLSAAEPHREWLPSSAIGALRLILAQHPELTFVITPPPGKEAAADEVLRRLDDKRVVAAPATSHLLDLVALLRRARVTITPDTANVHLAAAVGRPVLVLTSAVSTEPALWAPYGVPHRSVSAGRHPVSDIPASAVAEAFDSLWAELVVSDAQETGC
jgi:ADP-heptose:LPS heptosyltransferase